MTKDVGSEPFRSSSEEGYGGDEWSVVRVAAICGAACVAEGLGMQNRTEGYRCKEGKVQEVPQGGFSSLTPSTR